GGPPDRWGSGGKRAEWGQGKQEGGGPAPRWGQGAGPMILAPESRPVSRGTRPTVPVANEDEAAPVPNRVCPSKAYASRFASLSAHSIYAAKSALGTGPGCAAPAGPSAPGLVNPSTGVAIPSPSSPGGPTRDRSGQPRQRPARRDQPNPAHRPTHPHRPAPARVEEPRRRPELPLLHRAGP